MDLELLDHSEPEKEPRSSQENTSFRPIRFVLVAFFGMVCLWFCIGFTLVAQIGAESPGTPSLSFIGLGLVALVVYSILFSLSFTPVLNRRLSYAICMSIFWIVPPPFIISLAFLNSTARFSPSTTNVQVVGTLLVCTLISVLLGTVMHQIGTRIALDAA